MKTFKVLAAALAAVALAAPAFAVTADITGNLWVRGLMTDGIVDDDIDTKGIDQRLRLFTTAAANENVKMVLGLEIDNIWGREKADGKEIGAMGADAKGQIEIKHLYLDFKVPTIAASVRAGVQGFNVGRGMIINDDAAGLQFSMPVTGNNLSLIYIRPQAGDQKTGADNSNFFAAKYNLKLGQAKVAPYVGYYKEGSLLRDGEVLYLGVDVDGKVGNFGYAATAIWNDWDLADGAADGNGLALFGKVTTMVDRVGLSLEAGFIGDEDAGEFVSLTQGSGTGAVVNISEITTGGRFATNSSLTANLFGSGNLYRTNWMWAKIGADLKLTDASKLSAFIAHIEEAEDRSATQPARTYGQEVNVYYDYAIVPNLDLTLMGAYLLADEDVRQDDVWKLGTMLAYRF